MSAIAKDMHTLRLTHAVYTKAQEQFAEALKASDYAQAVHALSVSSAMALHMIGLLMEGREAIT